MYDVMDITESLIEGAVKHLTGRKTTLAFYLEGRGSRKHKTGCNEPRTNASLSTSLLSLCISPAFIVGHPQVMSPFAKYHQLDDPFEQWLRFKERAMQKGQDDGGAQGIDETFVDAGRVDIGTDRPLTFLADPSNIREVLSDPLDKFFSVFSHTLGGWEGTSLSSLEEDTSLLVDPQARPDDILLSSMTSFEIHAITLTNVPAAGTDIFHYFTPTQAPAARHDRRRGHAPHVILMIPIALSALVWLDLDGFTWNKRDTEH
ncbi:uncharacterized protein PHACADRAFT_215000 [Phanerochaete carnosa HHB-10118-sp]|uniref:Uncharacterized protein n=1 Tax=Phanerochaete carnosa (strain HHB-10118-sp) TaxID=650164 RepID=K5VA83_PHACS|nr:uncharacterized protein PHACADRAFT_215000 [Phanerochaete carnosa HHB-10118-sp]EKM47993.1 hypothetical protein PHACADRAFT_215000 [Phanerochaete carnosa HHB-10118-sp]